MVAVGAVAVVWFLTILARSIDMGIDPRIALGVQPVQLQDPTNQLAKMLEIQGAQDNRKLNMLKMGEYERGLADENQMRDLTRQAGGDMGKLRDLTYGAGNYKQGMALDKTIGERKTTDLANRKTELEGHLKKFEVAGQIMSNVRDQASWEVARQQTAQVFGQDAAAQMPPQYDPRLVEQKRLQAMSIKDQVAAEHQELVLAETGRSNRAREGLTAQGQQITVRGQNMTDARSRESTAATLTKPFEITGADGKPVLVQQDKQGNIREVTGYTPKQGASKPLTEGQSKALLFGSRMQESGAILDELATQGKTKSVPGSRSGYGVGATITALSGEKNQKLEQAKRDFINATLRRESGAVINPDEFDNAEKQYFPQIGDTPAVIAQKKSNREVATRGILAEVPDAENRVKKVRGGGATDDTETKPAPIKDKAAFDALASGATFIAPDGTTRRKP